MNGGKTAGGYTIVEAMIFLAITGALFIIAYGFIANKQATAEFNQASRDFQSQIDDVINDVPAGYYPNNSQLGCFATNSGPNFFTGINTAGTNLECVFAGKVLQFGDGSDHFNVYSLAGLRKDASLKEVTKLDDERVRAIARNVVWGGGPDLTQTNNLQFGLKVTNMYYEKGNTTPRPIAAFGVLSTLTGYGVTGDPISGDTAITIVPIDPSNLNELNTLTPQQFARNRIDAGPNPAIAPPINEAVASPDIIVICFKGGNDKVGGIQISSRGTTELLLAQINTGKTGAELCL